MSAGQQADHHQLQQVTLAEDRSPQTVEQALDLSLRFLHFRRAQQPQRSRSGRRPGRSCVVEELAQVRHRIFVLPDRLAGSRAIAGEATRQAESRRSGAAAFIAAIDSRIGRSRGARGKWAKPAMEFSAAVAVRAACVEVMADCGTVPRTQRAIPGLPTALGPRGSTGGAQGAEDAGSTSGADALCEMISLSG